MPDLLRRAGNKLYQFAFPLYRPFYSAFKAYADRNLRKLLTTQVKPGDVVVDAGANIGIYSQFFSKCVGDSGIVHSFEPDPTNFMRLEEVLADTSNVRLNRMAVGDRTGEGLLYKSDRLNVDHRVYPTQERGDTAPIVISTLDDYFEDGERVDLIKMDVQGYELHGLRGAERVLHENARVKLLLECWPLGLSQAGTSVDQLLRFLRERDFELYEEYNGTFRLSSLTARLENKTGYFDLFASREKQWANTANQSTAPQV